MSVLLYYCTPSRRTARLGPADPPHPEPCLQANLKIVLLLLLHSIPIGTKNVKEKFYVSSIYKTSADFRMCHVVHD